MFEEEEEHEQKIAVVAVLFRCLHMRNSYKLEQKGTHISLILLFRLVLH